MAAPCFLVIKAVGVFEMLKIYIFTEEGNELELETNVSNFPDCPDTFQIVRTLSRLS